jgi:hypothetical protein
MASILLDHNYSYDRLYKALRTAGVPTGETYDVLSVEKDLKDLFPPITDANFLVMISQMFRRAEQHEVKTGIATEQQVTEGRAVVAEYVATLLTLGRLNKKNGKFYFNRKGPVYDWDKAARKRYPRTYDMACLLMNVPPITDKKEEEAK